MNAEHRSRFAQSKSFKVIQLHQQTIFVVQFGERLSQRFLDVSAVVPSQQIQAGSGLNA